MQTLSDILLPAAAGTVVALAVLAFALYAWTWARYIASSEVTRRPLLRERPCASCPAAA